ncbi:MAG: hypothetical protein IJB00_04570 [Akkermansia sp.]|nr:hypothetical protein [Akkermansia sp.]
MEILVSIGMLVAVLAWVVSVYTRLFHLRNEVLGAWKQWVLATRSRNEQLGDFAEAFARVLPQGSPAPHRLRSLADDSEHRLREMAEPRWGASGESFMPGAEWLLQRALHESMDEAEHLPQMLAHPEFQQLCGLMSMALYQQEHRTRLFNRAAQEYNSALVTPGGRALASVFGFLPSGSLGAPSVTPPPHV